MKQTENILSTRECQPRDQKGLPWRLEEPQGPNTILEPTGDEVQGIAAAAMLVAFVDSLLDDLQLLLLHLATCCSRIVQ